MKAISVLLLICASCTGGAIDPGYSLVARIHAVDGGAIPGAELRLFCADSISGEVADSGGTISQLGIGIGRELTCKIVIKAAGYQSWASTIAENCQTQMGPDRFRSKPYCVNIAIDATLYPAK